MGRGCEVVIRQPRGSTIGQSWGQRYGAEPWDWGHLQAGVGRVQRQESELWEWGRGHWSGSSFFCGSGFGAGGG